jgi:bifunctional polynucleotide phosphatase/kinase
LEELYQAGFSIVLITNQGIKSRQLDDWKKKIHLVAAALPAVPFRILAATARDGYRKPLPGMWYELERIYREDGIIIDKTASLFVGDAAGRKFDFAATDRKWASNIGIPFFTPEEYFLGAAPAPFTINGTAFDVSSLPDLPPWTPTSTPLLPPHSKPEIVVFSGYPCLGKSTFFRRHFQPAGYTHVNQDTLKTRPKCVKATEEAVLAGKSCVVDNTNRDVQTRKYYIDLAKKLSVPIRCFFFTGSKELAWHNNLYRAYNMPLSAIVREPQRDLIPWAAFTGFEAAQEEPVDSEGFDEIKRVNWVFQGDADEKRRWCMWLQIDGK